MTRISSLFAAATLAILPISAFAQPAATSAAPTVNAPATSAAAKPATTAAETPKTVAPGVKTAAPAKDAKSSHAKLGTTAPTAPAKTVEPSKS